MRCPVCNEPLIVVERDSIEVDYCVRCHGLWFDHGEVELLGEKAGVEIDLGNLDLAPPSASSERYLHCPRCTAKMRKADLYRGEQILIVDFCPEQHGIWFDRGETGRLIGTAERISGSAADMITRFLGETFDTGQPTTTEEA